MAVCTSNIERLVLVTAVYRFLENGHLDQGRSANLVWLQVSQLRVLRVIAIIDLKCGRLSPGPIARNSYECLIWAVYYCSDVGFVL
eukprot:305862-Prorocentrum_minimum.AAC.2